MIMVVMVGVIVLKQLLAVKSTLGIVILRMSVLV